MKTLLWNDDKPHRCPMCHAITDPNRRSRWQIVTCCRCGTRFARWPWLAKFLPTAGVVCPDVHEG